jgi:hypothetical protein
MTRLANRTQELNLFTQMVKGQLEQRILLIQAPSGYGKSGLMDRFEALCPKPAAVVTVNLKSALDEGIFYLFRRTKRVLGADRFRNFDATVDRFLNAGVEIRGNKLTGDHSKIQVILQCEPEQRQVRLVELQEAFFEDLRRLGKVVFILDTFNEANAEVAQWVESCFLMEVAENPHLCAVVAGQTVPKPNIEWKRYHRCCELDRITSHEVWYDYAIEAGLTFDKSEIGMMVDCFKGIPSQIVDGLETVRRGRQRA